MNASHLSDTGWATSVLFGALLAFLVAYSVLRELQTRLENRPYKRDVKRAAFIRENSYRSKSHRLAMGKMEGKQ